MRLEVPGGITLKCVPLALLAGFRTKSVPPGLRHGVAQRGSSRVGGTPEARFKAPIGRELDATPLQHAVNYCR